MSPNKLLIASAVATLLSAATARATLVRNVTFDDKVANADSIVLGHCTATKTLWDPQHRWIITYATFQVDESIKGVPAREMTVVTPGGSVDGVHQSSVGITPFEKGDERVLFVKPTPLGPTVLYFDQGTYSVSKDATGERVITPIASEAVHMDSQAGKVVPLEQPRTLRDFIGDVRASQRRIEAMNAAAMVKAATEQAQQPTSPFQKYWLYFVLAGLGIALAAVQIFKK